MLVKSLHLPMTQRSGEKMKNRCCSKRTFGSITHDHGRFPKRTFCGVSALPLIDFSYSKMGSEGVAPKYSTD